MRRVQPPGLATWSTNLMAGVGKVKATRTSSTRPCHPPLTPIQRLTLQSVSPQAAIARAAQSDQ